MSAPLDLRVGALRVVCAEAAKGVPHLGHHGDVAATLRLEPGDLAVTVAGAYAAIRQADRRALAEAIAPPGSLIGCPPEIAPLLEGGP